MAAIDVTITQVMIEGGNVLVTAERRISESQTQVVQVATTVASLVGKTGAQKRAVIVPLLRAAFEGPAAPAQDAALVGPITLP